MRTFTRHNTVKITTVGINAKTSSLLTFNRRLSDRLAPCIGFKRERFSLMISLQLIEALLKPQEIAACSAEKLALSPNS